MGRLRDLLVRSACDGSLFPATSTLITILNLIECASTSDWLRCWDRDFDSPLITSRRTSSVMHPEILAEATSNEAS